MVDIFKYIRGIFIPFNKRQEEIYSNAQKREIEVHIRWTFTQKLWSDLMLIITIITFPIWKPLNLIMKRINKGK